MHLNRILEDYTSGVSTLETANRALTDVGAFFRLDPERSRLTRQEKLATTVGCCPEQACGWGLLDTGSGILEKVLVRQGRLAEGSGSFRKALLAMAGRTYHVRGRLLTE